MDNVPKEVVPCLFVHRVRIAIVSSGDASEVHFNVIAARTSGGQSSVQRSYPMHCELLCSEDVHLRPCYAHHCHQREKDQCHCSHSQLCLLIYINKRLFIRD